MQRDEEIHLVLQGIPLVVLMIADPCRMSQDFHLLILLPWLNQDAGLLVQKHLLILDLHELHLVHFDLVVLINLAVHLNHQVLD